MCLHSMKTFCRLKDIIQLISIQMFKETLLKIFVVIIGVSMGAIILNMTRGKGVANKPKHKSSRNVYEDIKYILYWSPFWTTKDYFYGYGFHPFKDCEYKNCFATDNRTFVTFKKYDALLFHTTYNKKKHGVPWARYPHQRYILMNLEAPVHICPNLTQYAGYFNWTISYRLDSDIVRKHGYIVRQKTNYVIPSSSSDIIGSKKKLVAWFVSHCNTPGKRERLVKQLQKFIPVDVYGKCGKLKYLTVKGHPKVSTLECYNMVERDYKFYLSFENSFCRDYVTEKLYNLLLKNVVPVVYGGSNYSVFTPPHSVINAVDFKSAGELTAYLKFLDKNDTEYVKYFEWKRDYVVKTSSVFSACQICQKLNEPLQHKVYHNLHEWWWGVNKSMCKSGRGLPKIVSSVL